jgi:outer membrane protein TolC
MKIMRHKFIKPLNLLLFLLLATTVSVQAQPLKLSFDQAWEMAQSRNPQMRQAMLESEKADAQIGEAYASAMPTVTGSLYYQRNFVIPEMVSELPPEFGGGTMKFKFEQDNLINGQIELAQPLYAAGKVGLALQIAKLYKKATNQAFIQTEAETRLLITELYFGAAVAHEWAKVMEESYDQLEAHLEKVEDMHTEGIVSEYDLIRSRVQVSNFYPQVISARTAQTVALEALAIALNLPRDQEIELTDNLYDFQLDRVDTEDAYRIALENRPELKQLEFQEQMLKKLLKIEKHGIWWPNLFLVGGFTRTAQEPDFDWGDYYWMENLYAGLSLSIPLFDGFKAKYRAQQVRVDIKSLGIAQEQTARGINLELIQAQSRLEEALKNVKAQVEGKELAEKGFHIAEVRYDNGLATQLEVMDAQIALNQAKTNELTARYNAITAQAALQKALGRH